MRDTLIQVSYLVASVLFILGLRSLTRPDKARSGMQMAAIGMLFAIAGTLLNHTIIDYRWIVGGLVLGVIFGYPMGMWVPMTAMPQRIALSLTLSAAAATLVGVAEYYTEIHDGTIPTHVKMIALAFEIMLGSITVGGTIIAAGKLQEWLPSKPLTFAGQNVVNGIVFLGVLALAVYSIIEPSAQWAFYTMIASSLVFGVTLVLPIGGADMPVVVALLNSYSGLASCATGFAIGNVILIISGSLDGASGFILSILMSKAMNRSLGNVLFSGFGEGAAAATEGVSGSLKPIEPSDAGVMMAFAQKVIVIPGYGMAVAQAQHKVWELCQLLIDKGVNVRFAIHPVAGRMPGHMNVLLAEAGVPYDLISDLDEINAEFDTADVALVIGANDVVNPVARTDKSSPIYGMPILNADKAKNVIVIKRGQGAGFSGIENALFYLDNTRMLYGDGQAKVAELVQAVKAL
jgi:NAD(P) transhydrogenase subunit beta